MADAKKVQKKKVTAPGRPVVAGSDDGEAADTTAPAASDATGKAKPAKAGATTPSSGPRLTSVTADKHTADTVRGTRARTSGRVTEKGTQGKGKPGASTRYTPPADRTIEMPSPWYIPAIMFTLWGVGILLIFLNYVELLPGAQSNFYLLGGLGAILAGIIVATQYR